MPKLRKMLGDIRSQQCAGLMALIQTQSKKTLASWAISYAQQGCLGIFEETYPHITALRDGISACEEYLEGKKKLPQVKPYLQNAAKAARETVGPAEQAAARAISAACAVIQTPTNALGFLFYYAAAAAYHTLGLECQPKDYDDFAAQELQKALDSLRQAAVPQEEHPVNIQWNC